MTFSKFDCLYLHVGRHKTGTSALQKFFQINEKKLLKNKILYPREGMDQSLGAHHSFFFPLHPRSPIKYRNVFDENIDKILPLAETGLTLLMSTEMISEFQDYASLAKLKKIAPCIKVIIYFRRQDTYIESAYSESVKGGTFLGSSIFEFIELQDRFGALDYKKICEKWSDVFGKENVIVRAYERGQFKGGNIFADFMSVIGVNEINDFHIPTGNINPSLTPDTLYFKKDANKLIADSIWRRRLQDPLVEISLKHGEIKLFQKHSIFPPATKLALLERFQEGNALVAKDFLNRNDLCLFYDPLPSMDDDWQPYAGLSKEAILNIAEYIANEYPGEFSVLVRGIQKGLRSEDATTYEAAERLEPILWKKKSIVLLIRMFFQSFLITIKSKILHVISKKVNLFTQ